jgi:hypothetical protein
MNALSTHHRPLRRSSRKSSQHRRDDALYSRFRRLVAEALEDRCLLTLGIPEVGQVANPVAQVANPVGQVANLPNDAITPAAAQAVELFNVSPALFVENVGQWSDPAVRYAFQGSGANVLQTQAGPVIQLFQRDPVFQRDPAQGPDKVGPALPAGTHDVGPALPAGTAGPTWLVHSTQFSVQFEGANSVEPMGLDQAATVYNYFVGDQSNWRSAVPTFQKVGYQGLYDGIDLYTWGRPQHAGSPRRRPGQTGRRGAGRLDAPVHAAADFLWRCRDSF